jgi:hypothetical protein
MAGTNQLFAHYAALQTDGLLDAVVMHFRRWAELQIEAFWERYPLCDRDPGQLNAAGKVAHGNLLGLLRARRECVIRDARLLLASREECASDKDDLPELDDAVVNELRRMQKAHEDDRRHRLAEATLEEKRRAARAADDAFDEALERHTEGLFDYANGDGPGPWFAAAREGGDE